MHDYQPAFSWTGLYAGINAGYGFGELAQIPDSGLGNTKAEGWTAGGQIGYNYQFGKVIFGIEADLNYAAIKGSRTTDLCVGCGIPYTVEPKLNWFGTIRPRLGYDIGYGLLPYVTAGPAYGSVSVVERMDFGGGGISTTTTKQGAVGYAWGGGIEYALAHDWTVRAEYLRLELDLSSTNSNFSSAQVATSTDIFRGALNRKF